MSRARWSSCTDPLQILDWVGAATTDRKLRLFMTAYCRLMWRHAHPFQSDDSYYALIVADRFVEGEATKKELDKAYFGGADDNAAYMPGCWGIYSLACLATVDDGLAARYREYLEGLEPDIDEMGQLPKQCKILRDVFANPFRPVNIDVAEVCSKTRARKDAESMYESREFSELPALGALLARAGCTDPQILKHCASKGPHVRGCWVVDLILGKA
jgi:hypothetical protein